MNWNSAALAALLAVAPAAQAAFKCVDEKGKSHFQDTPPAACGNVVIYEVGPSGSVIRKIEPTRAPSANAAKDALNERAAAEQKRRDRALLDSYSAPGEFDVARDRNLEIIKARLEATKTRLGQVEQREGELKRALESYKGKPAPVIQQDLDKVEAERAQLQASVARFQKDYDQTSAQFQADKARWIELRGTAK
jgi:hypothetical protein